MRFSKVAFIGFTLLCFFMAIPFAMAEEVDFSKSVCWKVSVPRGVGTIPICAPDHDKDAGLCYDKCSAGWNGVGPVCWQPCPEGYKSDGVTCRKDAHIFKKDSYGRGVGKVKKIDDGEKQAGLWYKACNSGYKGKGPVCWKECPADYKDDGGTCRKDVSIIKHESKGRGVGTVPKTCPSDKPQLQAGLCYKACPPNFKGVGPVCWPVCKTAQAGGVKMPTECGAACTTNPDNCAKWSMQWANAGMQVLVSAVSAIAMEDPSKLEGLIEAQKKFPVNLPNCQ